MKYLITTILLVFASLSFALAANDSSKLPVSVFTSDTLIRDARISPNGAYLAIVSRVDGDERLIVLDMKTRQPISNFYVRGKIVVLAMWTGLLRIDLSMERLSHIRGTTRRGILAN